LVKVERAGVAEARQFGRQRLRRLGVGLLLIRRLRPRGQWDDGQRTEQREGKPEAPTAQAAHGMVSDRAGLVARGSPPAPSPTMSISVRSRGAAGIVISAAPGSRLSA